MNLFYMLIPNAILIFPVVAYCMAEGQRRSSRPVKIKRDSNFVYEAEAVNFLSRTVLFHSSPSVTEGSKVNIGEINGKDTTDVDSLIWTDPFNAQLISSNGNVLSSESPVFVEETCSQSQSCLQNTTQLGGAGRFVYSSGSDICSERGYRHNSSTRLDYLSFEDPFLSVSPTVHTDASDMDQLCVCSSGKLAKNCCAEAACSGDGQGAEAASSGDGQGVDSSLKESEFIKTLQSAIAKIDKLSDKVKGLETHIIQQDEVIKELRASSSKGGSTSSEHIGVNKSKTKVHKTKGDRVQEEKERQLRLLQERLKDKDKENSESRAGSGETSDGALDLKLLRKKMSKKQQGHCKKRESELLKRAGAAFPDQDFETTTSSGTDSGSVTRKCSSSRRKVKSGASIKKRPVLRTELWPHTVANEEDGEEVACDNISLAKFFACFTHIMLDCKRLESQGRAGLLHAVSLVLESLFWAEARTFHNLVMVKIEQGRLSWTDDFAALAESFIDRKVRQSVRSKGSASYGAANKTGSYGRGNGNSIRRNYGYNNFGNNNYNNNNYNKLSGKSKSLYNSVCRQWNFGTCSFGDRCNRWHVCWTCAEAGKVGEAHRASSHEKYSTGPRQGDQRT